MSKQTKSDISVSEATKIYKEEFLRKHPLEFEQPSPARQMAEVLLQSLASSQRSLDEARAEVLMSRRALRDATNLLSEVRYTMRTQPRSMRDELDRMHQSIESTHASMREELSVDRQQLTSTLVVATDKLKVRAAFEMRLLAVERRLGLIDTIAGNIAKKG